MSPQLIKECLDRVGGEKPCWLKEGGRMRHSHHKVGFSRDPKLPTHTVPCPYEGDSPMWPPWRKQSLWESSWEPQ